MGIVRARGSDAVSFLQGQLSNDVTRLGSGSSMLAGYHNPQGRTIALLRLVRWDEDDILAIVPRELAGSVAMRLGKFVFRAKVKITDESAAWRVSGGIDAGRHPVPQPTSSRVAIVPLGAVPLGISPVGDERALVIEPREHAAPTTEGAGDRETWLRLDIAAGQPQVYAATSEEFVAQMLNLDVLNGIAFDKGCYTGQEVIARAHYRGRVKRRMQRFVSREALRLAPGDSGQLSDGRAFKVVLAAQLADGRCDFLAVAPLAGAGAEEPASSPSTGAEARTGAAAQVAVDQAPLPYSLPE
jgi:folate-binding protein YgfZ